MSTIPDGANVVVFGNGAMECLTGRLAAVRGFKVTQLVAGDLNEAKSLCFDETYHPEGSIPLKLVPLTGPEATNEPIDEAVMNADALIVTFDDQRSVLSEKQLNVIMPTDSKIKHISLMSRYLNGAGMGFFANAAQATNNPDVWALNDRYKEAYKKMEDVVRKRAEDCGATFSIIRAGTLKGGALGDKDEEGGEKSFLNRAYYDMGIKDAVNWRLLFDMNGLGVEISKGDTLPGPGFTAALTARSEIGDGDAHRGAVAAALVESLRTPSAHGTDWSVKAIEARDFPSAEEIQAMFKA
jgi:hypothetical protein